MFFSPAHVGISRAELKRKIQGLFVKTSSKAVLLMEYTQCGGFNPYLIFISLLVVLPYWTNSP